MRIQIKELLASSNSLARIGALELNTALKFRFGRVLKQVADILADFNKSKDDLIKKLGGEYVNQKLIFPNKQAEAQADKEYAQLVEEEVEIKFDLFSEKSFEKETISSADIANVLWLFKEEGKTEEQEEE